MYSRLLHVLVVPRFLAPMNPLSPGTFGQAHCTYFRFTCSLLSCGRQIPSSDLVLAGDPWVRYLGALVTYFCEGFCWGPIPTAQRSRPLLIVEKQLQCVYSWIQVRLWWDQWWQETMWPLRWRSIYLARNLAKLKWGQVTSQQRVFFFIALFFQVGEIILWFCCKSWTRSWEHSCLFVLGSIRGVVSLMCLLPRPRILAFEVMSHALTIGADDGPVLPVSVTLRDGLGWFWLDQLKSSTYEKNWRFAQVLSSSQLILGYRMSRAFLQPSELFIPSTIKTTFIL